MYRRHIMNAKWCSRQVRYIIKAPRWHSAPTSPTHRTDSRRRSVSLLSCHHHFAFTHCCTCESLDWKLWAFLLPLDGVKSLHFVFFLSLWLVSGRFGQMSVGIKKKNALQINAKLRLSPCVKCSGYCSLYSELTGGMSQRRVKWFQHLGGNFFSAELFSGTRISGRKCMI